MLFKSHNIWKGAVELDLAVILMDVASADHLKIKHFPRPESRYLMTDKQNSQGVKCWVRSQCLRSLRQMIKVYSNIFFYHRFDMDDYIVQHRKLRAY